MIHAIQTAMQVIVLLGLTFGVLCLFCPGTYDRENVYTWTEGEWRSRKRQPDER